ncbi:hypothetical protein GS896_27475 [Rhodococcus hoagii]|nr:hypothetical protein [Prescottella equi]MBM4570261.1 hypothetical protein [Prescottella equi]MBM4574801.1 hypothetical protein [Prescottella equi]MBM4653993.1 hypothetical protein [Prescottella equi]MBM4719744.1 hypothetical protein [Prescottella equi]
MSGTALTIHIDGTITRSEIGDGDRLAILRREIGHASIEPIPFLDWLTLWVPADLEPSQIVPNPGAIAIVRAATGQPTHRVHGIVAVTGTLDGAVPRGLSDQEVETIIEWIGPVRSDSGS